MSTNRVCPNCYRTDGFRVNFGKDKVAETEFHRCSWCDCGYSSPEEMMQEQDLGFEDPRWVLIAKHFLNEYYKIISQRILTNKDQHMRFFLKSLKRSAENYRISIELVSQKNNENREYKYIGKTKLKPHINIFDNPYDLIHLPEKVTLDIFNDKIFNLYKHSQQDVAELESKHIKKNRLIAILVLLLIIVGVIAIL